MAMARGGMHERGVGFASVPPPLLVAGGAHAITHRRRSPRGQLVQTRPECMKRTHWHRACRDNSSRSRLSRSPTAAYLISNDALDGRVRKAAHQIAVPVVHRGRHQCDLHARISRVAAAVRVSGEPAGPAHPHASAHPCSHPSGAALVHDSRALELLARDISRACDRDCRDRFRCHRVAQQLRVVPRKDTRHGNM